jgi:hypothetical protein
MASDLPAGQLERPSRDVLGRVIDARGGAVLTHPLVRGSASNRDGSYALVIRELQEALPDTAARTEHEERASTVERQSLENLERRPRRQRHGRSRDRVDVTVEDRDEIGCGHDELGVSTGPSREARHGQRGVADAHAGDRRPDRIDHACDVVPRHVRVLDPGPRSVCAVRGVDRVGSRCGHGDAHFAHGRHRIRDLVKAQLVRPSRPVDNDSLHV